MGERTAQEIFDALKAELSGLDPEAQVYRLMEELQEAISVLTDEVRELRKEQ